MNETRTKPRVLIIGAGFSGLCLGYHLNKTGLAEFTILEKGDRLGGTWRDNTYPGAACDVPSISYCFSFAQKTDWSRKWSPQPEILEYMEKCADDFDIRRHIRFGVEVAGARFDERAGLWTVTTTEGEEFEAEYLVSAVGQLHQPQMPNLEGIDTFAGPSFHSARWQHDVDLTGKTVAVVGSAASAIQFIPQIAKQAAKVVVVQRSPNWMVRRNDRFYTDKEKQRLGRHRWRAKLYRWCTWLVYEVQFPAFAGWKPASALYRRSATAYLEQTIADPDLRKALTPEYPLGARRILISDDYYEALARDNVELVTDAIASVDAAGLVTDSGERIDADVIVYATGFRTTDFLVPMTIEGRGGVDLRASWKEGAEAYLGLTVSGFPNFFMMYGPNTNLGHNSIIFMIECQTAYIVDSLRRAASAGARWMDVRPEVQRRFNEEVQRKLGRRVWARVERSWYKTAAGRITNNWSSTTLEYWWRTRRADPSDYTLAAQRIGAGQESP